MVTKDIFMLCDSTDEESSKVLDPEIWKANLKYDGERILGIKMKDTVLLMNRRGKECSLHFQEVVEELMKLPPFTIVDGEVISYDDDFNKLQRRAHTLDKAKQIILQKEIPVKYYIFDILKLESETLIDKPLTERIARLNKMMAGLNEVTGTLELAEYGEIEDMLRKAKSEDREGIIIKNMDSVYESKRSKNCLKLKFFVEGTIFVTKYTTNNAGIRVEDDLGNCVQCSGKQHEELKQLLDTTKRVEINIQYLEITKDGKFRFPSYRGIVK
jgi:ATP-dependent DNA ligase